MFREITCSFERKSKVNVRIPVVSYVCSKSRGDLRRCDLIEKYNGAVLLKEVKCLEFLLDITIRVQHLAAFIFVSGDRTVPIIWQWRVNLT